MSSANPFEGYGPLVPGVKISRLPEADLPLSGDELIPLTQDGLTKSAPASAVAGAQGGAVVWSGVAVQALAIGVNNDVNVDLSEASVLAVTLTGDSELNSLVAPGTPGQVLFIQNRSTVFTLTIPNESTGTAANRFASNGDPIYPPRCGGLYRYDGGVQRWVKA